MLQDSLALKLRRIQSVGPAPSGSKASMLYPSALVDDFAYVM